MIVLFYHGFFNYFASKKVVFPVSNRVSFALLYYIPMGSRARTQASGSQMLAHACIINVNNLISRSVRRERGQTDGISINFFSLSYLMLSFAVYTVPAIRRARVSL